MANSNNESNKRGANKTKRPHRRTNSGLHGGKPPFVPTADQKRMVMALAGLRMSWDEMRQIVRNPNTDQPIAKATFARVFRRELAEGGARLKQLISSKYYEALREGRDWAIRAGLKNRFGWSMASSAGLVRIAAMSSCSAPSLCAPFEAEPFVFGLSW
jgi:hypothetical protein